MRSARRIWLVQLLWALFGGLPFLLLPRFIAAFTTGRHELDVPPIEVDQVRMVGATSMGLVCATALATSRQVLAWQRGMAAIFLVFMLEWSAILILDQRTGFYRPFVPYLTVYPALGFALLNAVVLLQPGRNAPVVGSRVDAAPVRLRWLWAVQGVWYAIEAGVCLLAAESVLAWVTGREANHASLTRVAVEQVRIVSAWTLALALASLYASLDHQIRDWRQWRWAFAVALLIRAGGAAANVAAGSTAPLAAATLAVPALCFAFVGFRWTLGAVPASFRAVDPLAPMRNADSDAPPPPVGQSALTWLWTIQTALLLALGVLCLAVPRSLLARVTEVPQIPRYASDALRISGAFLLGLAGFNVFALMRSRTVFRRPFAIAFSVAFAASCIALWLEVASELYTGAMAVVCSGLTLFALLNLHWAIRRPPDARPEDDAGVAGSKPASAFVGWLLQLLGLGIAGVTLLVSVDTVLAFLTGDATLGPRAFGSAALLIESQWRLVGILSVTAAVFTGIGMASQRDPVWRGFAFFWSVAFVLLSIVSAFVISADRYRRPALVALALGVVLVYLNRWIGGHPATWTTEDSDPERNAWTVLDLVAGPLMGISVLLTKRRSSHLLGVGVRGVFRVSGNVGATADSHDRSFPLNDFFVPGREYPVQARFANLTELDDASLDVRGCALKFSDQRAGGPLDLLMNTGTYCPAYDLVTFAGFVASKFIPTFGSKVIVESNAIAREGGVAGLRRAPDSYAQLHYYGQIVRHWVDFEGVRHLVRYRCIPETDAVESGLPSDEDASHIWLRDRLPSESRPTDYLRAEMRRRVDSTGVRMRLQAQFHRPRPGDTDDWYDASVDWDERECPWIDLGQLALDRSLPDPDTELLLFDPGNHPMTLGVPRATGPFDYRSMGDSEARVVRALQRLRVWMYGVFGMPPFGEVEPAAEQQR
jgi:arachidonate 5-lipoxygenase